MSIAPITARSLSETYAATARLCLNHNLDIPYSHTTALALERIELPSKTSLQPAPLHASVPKSHMRRSKFAGVHVHTWSALNDADIVYITPQITAVRPEVAWAQLAKYANLETSIILAEAILRNTYLTLDDLAVYITGIGKFPGKRQCRRALLLARPGADSAKECELRLKTLQYGLDQPKINYVFPDLTFPNGAPVTLDMAWPEHRVGLEYNGDHHRTDMFQWRRDEWKREAVTARRWHFFSITQLDLSDNAHTANLMARISEAMGKRISYTPLEKLADRRRKICRPDS
ncbi:hypothetical protein [Bifidobacterium catulorum]|uniref:DUF559 domain-containing protein n=1 Tax=Bifidobacterium catulorum TaxID=1630173 RepID=A0A2U2MQP6_9BIFI|nr:hypothetical protein [Bifidobacterium catulorum]PWG59164.1 hypothetical protein DF200_09065 [Bifidobacterium catulorum]